MMKKPAIGISSCLLGNPVRYDGGSKQDFFLTNTLNRFVNWVPVCPEVECGLPVPREAMQLAGDPDNPRLVAIGSGADHTARMKTWVKRKIRELEKNELCGFVFKSRSPSCALRGVGISAAKGRPKATGPGIFIRTFRREFPLLPVEDEEGLRSPAIRENFIERVFVYRRWREYGTEDGSLNGLVALHTSHKYLIMAHSRKHYSLLETIVAAAKRTKQKELLARYFETLMEGLKLPATPKKNADVLQRMAGHFNRRMTAEEKKELLETIARYRDGLVPLIVPITLIRHYVRIYREPCLSRQIYLDPHPLELLLRNHA